MNDTVVDESPEREAPNVQPAVPEDIPALEEGENPPSTRSDVINKLGEQLGKALIAEGYASVGALSSATDEELRAINGVGPKALEAIREIAPFSKKPEVVVQESAKSSESEEVEAQVGQDPEGVVTMLSKDKYEILLITWNGMGNPRSFNALGQRWQVYSEGTGGHRFVAVNNVPGMDYYNKVSTGRF
jgi:hypothetical protein